MDSKSKKLFRKVLIDNIKNSNWTGVKSEFNNKYFLIRLSSNNNVWSIHDYSGNSYNGYICPVSNIISPLYFKFLRIFYINRSLKKQEKIKIENIIEYRINNFFEKYKELKRDSRLNELLD